MSQALPDDETSVLDLFTEAPSFQHNVRLSLDRTPTPTLICFVSPASLYEQCEQQPSHDLCFACYVSLTFTKFCNYLYLVQTYAQAPVDLYPSHC